MGLLRNKSINVGRVLFLVVVVFAAQKGYCAEITVKADGSGDYATIQAAIDAAVGGDEVVLEPGTYAGWGNRDIDYKGKAVTVRSVEPNNPEVVSATIIDCQGSAYSQHRGFYFHSGEDANSMLAGLKITNGFAPNVSINTTTFYSEGGGILCFDSSPIITNCQIENNRASIVSNYYTVYGWASGGGICCRGDSSPIISHCTITGNSVYGQFGGSGGGINTGGRPIITDCVISDNTASRAGGGLCCKADNTVIRNCTISNNSVLGISAYGAFGNCSSGGSAHGGGVYMWCNPDSEIKIQNCKIYGNTAEGGNGTVCEMGYPPVEYGTDGGDAYGGGIYCNFQGNSKIENCIIYDNSVDGGSGGIGGSPFPWPPEPWEGTPGEPGEGYGGNICSSSVNSLVRHCIIGEGEADFGPSIAAIQESYSDPSYISVLYNNLKGGAATFYAEEDCEIDFGEGNIDVNPLLTSDGHLRAGSVCIDAGEAGYIPEPNDMDIDGELHGYDGIVDIGIDEFIDSDGDGLPDWWEEKYFGDITAAEPDDDPDDDGRDNLSEYASSSNPLWHAFYYVNPVEGDDSWDGLSAEWDGVHGPKATIQAAIDAADPKEGTVILSAGTYTGEGNRDVDFKGKAVTVRSTDPYDDDVVAATVIDCEASSTEKHRGFKFVSGEGADSVLAGVTITGGIGPEEELEGQDVYAGNAVFCKGSSPTIRNCVMTENKTYGRYNAAVFTAFGSPTITDCTISDNLCSGIVCWITDEEDAGSPVISDCVISGNNIGVFCGNWYTEGLNGSPSIINCVIKKNASGGIYGTSGLVKDCIITGNSSTRRGGGILCGSATITGCVISNNSSEDEDGGGIYSFADIGATITNCTISGNFASKCGGGVCMYKGAISDCVITGNISEDSGGGISGLDGSFGYASITNCIISGNLSTREHGGCIAGCHGPITNCTIVGNQALGPGATTGGLYGCNGPVTNCIIRDNRPGQIRYADLVSYCNVEDGWEGEGNIDAEALFAMEGDYHLLGGSPCIDAGTNDPCGGLPGSDMDGAFRPVDGDGDGEAFADMGAYEFSLESPTIAVSARSLYFVQNHPAPEPQVLQIRNCGGEALYWEIVEDCEWLEVSDDNGVSTDDINEIVVTVDSNGLEPGLYHYELYISDVNASNSPLCVRVEMPVGVMREVPSAEYATIQAAMDAAADYDVVAVGDGVYTGEGNRDLDFKGKAITVCSANGPENCVIDAEGSESGFRMHSQEREDSVIEGFTITNCSLGGVYCWLEGSSPTVNNCVITENSGAGIVHVDGRPPTYRYSINISNCSITRNAGGVYCERGRITNCRVNDNERGGEGDFAGICCAGGSEIINCEVGGNDGIGIRCSSGGIKIRDCLVSDNCGDGGYSGGIYCGGYGISRAEISNCVVQNNRGDNTAGGIHCRRGDATIDNCTVSGNSSEQEGGGIVIYDGELSIKNCVIRDNRGGTDGCGGGISCEESDFEINNSVISGNLAFRRGGGINSNNSNGTITSCTIADNSAIDRGYSPAKGGGISCYEGIVVNNNIIRRNFPDQIDGSVLVSYSNVEGGWDGIGNTDSEPVFALEGDYHLMGGSAGIDWGDPNFLPDANYGDLDGSMRTVDGDGDGEAIIDTGAYEHNPIQPQIAVSPAELEFNYIEDLAVPAGQIVQIRNCGGGELCWQIREDSNSLEFSSLEGVSVNQENQVMVSLREPNGLLPGSYNYSFAVFDPNASNSERRVCVSLHVGIVRDVPDDYFTIQDAIDAANDYDMVLVGDGVYRGDGNRDLDFKGKTITVCSVNGPENCIIDCEGSEEEPHRGFKFGWNDKYDSVVRGLTIMNGYASYGGAISCMSCAPSVINCHITGNATDEGVVYYDSVLGGVISGCKIFGNSSGSDHIIFGRYSMLAIEDCVIEDNEGTGIYSMNGYARVSDCEVRGNSSGGAGGIYLDIGGEIRNCVVSDNSSNGNGGGIFCTGDIRVDNCMVSGNIADFIGGIFFTGWGRDVGIANSIITGNNARYRLGGVFMSHYDGEAIVRNCVISGNSASEGDGGISFFGRGDTKMVNCTVTGNFGGEFAGGLTCYQENLSVENCIIWGNDAAEGAQVYIGDTPESSYASINYSDVEGGEGDIYVEPNSVLDWGEGNIDAEPWFVESGYRDVNGTPDDMNDDFWVDGDYHLLSTSPCINAGDPDYVAGPGEVDLDGVPRVLFGRIDMGAYEYNYVETEMEVTPAMLNCGSSGNWVEAHFVLPEGYLPEDVDVNTPMIAEPVGAVSEYIEVLDEGDGNWRVVAVFDREAFCEAVGGEAEKYLEVTVIGAFTDGAEFYGTDTIRLISDHWQHRERDSGDK